MPEWVDGTLIDGLLADGEYIEHGRTLLIQPEGEPKQVLLILGDRYTVWTAATFRYWATRLLEQL
jgi:hypothetical protein